MAECNRLEWFGGESINWRGDVTDQSERSIPVRSNHSKPKETNRILGTLFRPRWNLLIDRLGNSPVVSLEFDKTVRKMSQRLEFWKIQLKMLSKIE
jgi:hypothetical protein